LAPALPTIPACRIIRDTGSNTALCPLFCRPALTVRAGRSPRNDFSFTASISRAGLRGADRALASG
jgi:hypothetical protein